MDASEGKTHGVWLPNSCGHLLHCGPPFPPSFVAALAQAVAAFVESVLRYGIPPDFVCALIRVRSGRDHAVPPRTVLDAF